MYNELYIKIGVHLSDDDKENTFIELAREAAQLLYTQSALLSTISPDLELIIEDNAHGTRKIKVFD